MTASFLSPSKAAKVGVEEEVPDAEVGHAPTVMAETCEKEEIKGNNEPDNRLPKHPPGLFTDDKGNLKFVNGVVKCPNLVFLLTLGTCIFITILLSKTVFANGNPFTDDSSQFDIYDTRSISYDSLRLASDVVREERRNAIEMSQPPPDDQGGEGEPGQEEPQVEVKEVRSQEKMGDITYWIFESKKPEGVFGSPEAISVMRTSEIMFTRHKVWPKYCWLRYNETGGSECRPSFSALNMYYASEWNSTIAQSIIEELTPENVKLYNSMSACVEYGVLCQYLPPSITLQNITWARKLNWDVLSLIQHWDGNGSLNDDVNEVTMLAAHLQEVVTKAPFVSFFFDKNFNLTNPVSMYSRSVIYWGSPLKWMEEEEENDSRRKRKPADANSKRREYVRQYHLAEMKKISSPDHNEHVNSLYFMLALFFDVIVDILLSDALKAILSFVLVFAYLRLMVGSWLLACVGMLEIVMSLPLAWFFFANVFGIKYFSSLNVLCLFIVAAIGADDIFVFMDAYKQSAHKGKDVLQSLESRMSWVYRRSGSAMLITSATTCSAFLCTVASPIASTRSFGIFAALVILFDYILVMTLFCTAVVIYHNRFEQPGCCCASGGCFMMDVSPTEKALKNADSDEGLPQDKISHFFREKFAGFILKGRNRGFLSLPFLVWIAAATYYTTTLEPTKTYEQNLDEDHPLQRSVNILRNEFPQTERDRGVSIYYMWGIDDVDRNGVNQLYDPEYIGNATFSDTFVFDEQCQTAMLDLCDALKTEDKYEAFVKRKNGGLRAVNCFVEELGAYNELGGLQDCDAVKDGSWKNETWQVSLDDVDATMENFVKQASCYGESPMLNYYGNEVGWNGTNLRYAGISLESPVITPWGTLAETVTRNEYDAYMSFAQEIDADMEKACGTKVLMTDLDQKFVFMNNQMIYRTSAVSGSMLGVLIAFFVLLISTRRLHIAFFATLSILCVLVSVIGSVTMMGWTLGTNEAILISILAGFSVDYVVHLAHAYVASTGQSTAERIKDSFGDMGISVFSGMLTSVVASIPLFLCYLTFFAKFGTFLCFTIAFSWIFANLFFMSIIAQANISMKEAKGLAL